MADEHKWTPINEVYPDRNEEYFCGPSDYGPLLRSFGYEVIVQVDDEDYQGDTRILYQNGDKYGLLVFGWGSCSGCDALQACDSFGEVDKLREELHQGIKWFESAAELLQHLQGKDWSLEFHWGKETEQFLEAVRQHFAEVKQ